MEYFEDNIKELIQDAPDVSVSVEREISQALLRYIGYRSHARFPLLGLIRLIEYSAWIGKASGSAVAFPIIDGVETRALRPWHVAAVVRVVNAMLASGALRPYTADGLVCAYLAKGQPLSDVEMMLMKPDVDAFDKWCDSLEGWKIMK